MANHHRSGDIRINVKIHKTARHLSSSGLGLDFGGLFSCSSTKSLLQEAKSLVLTVVWAKLSTSCLKIENRTLQKHRIADYDFGLVQENELRGPFNSSDHSCHYWL